MEDNIEKIRKDNIAEIKEKVEKNPLYLHPCNKERLEDMRRLKFENGYDFTCWMQQNGIMKSPTDIKRKEIEKIIENVGCKTATEYQDKCAQNAGFKNRADRYRDRDRERRHEIGRYLPKEFNKDCASWFGYIGENYVSMTFEDPIIMPYGNPGFDWICKKGEKIDHKCACLTYCSTKFSRWAFSIRYNNIADWFILSAWDNRDSLTPLHVWIFHKNDIVRGRKFWRREGINIANTPDGLREFEKYEVTNRLEKLRELCNRDKQEND